MILSMVGGDKSSTDEWAGDDARENYSSEALDQLLKLK